MRNVTRSHKTHHRTIGPLLQIGIAMISQSWMRRVPLPKCLIVGFVRSGHKYLWTLTSNPDCGTGNTSRPVLFVLLHVGLTLFIVLSAGLYATSKIKLMCCPMTHTDSPSRAHPTEVSLLFASAGDEFFLLFFDRRFYVYILCDNFYELLPEILLSTSFTVHPSSPYWYRNNFQNPLRLHLNDLSLSRIFFSRNIQICRRVSVFVVKCTIIVRENNTRRYSLYVIILL